MSGLDGHCLESISVTGTDTNIFHIPVVTLSIHTRTTTVSLHLLYQLQKNLPKPYKNRHYSFPFFHVVDDAGQR